MKKPEASGFSQPMRIVLEENGLLTVSSNIKTIR